MEANVQHSHSNNAAYPRPIEVREDSGCFQRNQKNKPQSNSAGAACLVFLSGGMNIAWGTGFAVPLYFQITIHMQICWFIGAIIGSIIGAAVCNYLQKKLIYLFSLALVVIGGILLMSLSTSSGAITTARYIDGFANGLVLVSTLVMVGEEAVKSMRGMLASTTELMCFSLGMYIQIFYSSFWKSPNMSFDRYQMQGLLSIIFAVVSFVIAFFLVIESPISYLLRGQEEQAIDSLRRLQRPFVVTTETYQQLEEHKHYIAVNQEMSFSQSALSGLPALWKLCLYRGIVGMSFSILLTSALLYSSIIAYGPLTTWPYILYGTVRWIGVLFTAFVIDSLGRKKPMLLGALVSGGIAIGIGVIFNDLHNLLNASTMTTALYLTIAFQLFAGIFITASSAYLSEAFPLSVKPFYIAISFSVEMLVQIIIASCNKTFYSIAGFCFTLGALLLVFFIFGILCLPETKHTTLREAQEKFRRFLSPRN